MARKKNKKQNKLEIYFNKHRFDFIKGCLIVFLLLFLFKNKSLVIIFLFEMIDWTKNVIKYNLPYFPIEVRFIFGVTASFYYSPVVGIIIFCLGIVNRTILHLDVMHVFKAIRHIPLFFLVFFLKGKLDFFTAAMAALTLNYIMKYLLKIAKDPESPFNSVFYLVTNYTFGTILFYLISILYYYLPFLA